MTAPTPTAPVEPTAAPAEPLAPAAAAPAPASAPLHDDPVIAKALEGLTLEQRETLLTTGGKNALAARLQETKDAKAAAATAAETARAELAQTLGKALGLVPDEAVDPAALTEQLTAQTNAAKQAQIELAVFRAAGAVNGDPAALLDSKTFLAKVASVDPTDSAAITAAITEAVAANPRLGVAAPGRPGSPTGMGPNPAQGGSASPAIGLDAQIEAATAAGDSKTAIRLKSQKALNTPN